MGDLSAHFDSSEFRDHRTHELKRSPAAFIAKLERLRELVGKPLYVVSGYRSPATNRAVGGARRSRHMVGDAVDLRRGYATVAEAIEAGFGGIGHCDGWVVHVDDRPKRRDGSAVIFADC